MGRHLLCVVLLVRTHTKTIVQILMPAPAYHDDASTSAHHRTHAHTRLCLLLRVWRRRPQNHYRSVGSCNTAGRHMSSPYVPFGVSVSEVYLAAKKFQRWMKDRRWKEIQESMKRGRKNPSLSGFLKHVYGTNHELLTWGESIIPCCVFRAPRGQISKPDSILSKKLESEAENLEEVTQRMGQTYLDLLLNTPAKPWNGKTYRMIDLQSQKRLRMRVAVGSYYNALRSCDILQFEILEQSNFASGTLNQQTYETFGERLGLRKRIARMSDDIITNGAGRSVAIGGETLIIFKVEGGRYNALFGERSSDRVAANPDLVDVLPSFMFQPVVDDFVNEYSLTHNIFREYLEEVFNLDEVKHP